MRRVDDDIVGDVRVQCNLVVLRRRVHVYSAGVVREVVVGDRQQFCVLHVEVDDTDSRIVQHANSAMLDVVGLERYTRIGLTNVLENETARFISCH